MKTSFIIFAAVLFSQLEYGSLLSCTASQIFFYQFSLLVDHYVGVQVLRLQRLQNHSWKSVDIVTTVKNTQKAKSGQMCGCTSIQVERCTGAKVSECTWFLERTTICTYTHKPLAISTYTNSNIVENKIITLPTIFCSLYFNQHNCVTILLQDYINNIDRSQCTLQPLFNYKVFILAEQWW